MPTDKSRCECGIRLELGSGIISRLLAVSFPELQIEHVSTTSKLFARNRNSPPCHEVHFLTGEIILGELYADPIQNEDLPCIEVERVQSKVPESASSHSSTRDELLLLRDREASFGRGLSHSRTFHL
jgi:hypothetical protein